MLNFPAMSKETGYSRRVKKFSFCAGAFTFFYFYLWWEGEIVLHMFLSAAERLSMSRAREHDTRCLPWRYNNLREVYVFSIYCMLASDIQGIQSLLQEHLRCPQYMEKTLLSHTVQLFYLFISLTPSVLRPSVQVRI